MRSVYGEFPEYHSSDDNLDYVKQDSLNESLELYLEVLDAMQLNGIYKNTISFCEPQLSKRGLYPFSASHLDRDKELKNMLWMPGPLERPHA